jgi:hypothetical protein
MEAIKVGSDSRISIYGKEIDTKLLKLSSADLATFRSISANLRYRRQVDII